MKKIVGIIAALAMVAGVAFADDPSVVPSLLEFKGSADFGWKADLDNETHGMYNNNSASLKITFVPKEVKKATAGDPLWGEIEIQTNAEGHELVNKPVVVPTAKVNKAKIHFVDGDFFVHLDILGPKLALDGLKGPLAVETEKDFGTQRAGDFSTKADGTFDKFNTPNGFTINFGVPVVSFNVSFADNGEDANWGASETPDATGKFTTKSKKNYSFLADATIKPIDGLAVYAGIAMSTAEGKDKLAFGANAKYTFAIDDTLSLIPAVAFHAYDFKTQKLGASLLFKWGPDGKEPKFLKLTPTGYGDYMSIGDKCTSGASVYFTKTLDAKDEATGKAIDDGAFGFAVYDNTLMSLIGEDAGDLSLAAKFTTTTADFGKGTLALAAAYSNTLLKDSDLPIGLTAKVSFGLALAEDDDKTAVAYELGLTQKTLIEFTELYLKYSGSQSKLAGAANAKKGAIDIGCKISL